MTNPSPWTEKQALRAELRQALRETDPVRRAHWGAQICAHLAPWLTAGAERPRVALYAALPTEVDLRPLHGALPGAIFSYPLVSGANLEFFRVDAPAELSKGRFGIPEPDPARHLRTAPDQLDVCLCPGLGFSARGVRLGRGKAYYDNFLAQLSPAVARVGVCYEMQVRPYLPCEPHDILMSWLVTEASLMKCAAE